MPLTRNEARRLFAFFSEIRRTRAYVLILFLSLDHLGSGVLLAFIPTLSTEYFTSTLERSEGVVCVGLEEGEEPIKVCKEAHTLAVAYDAGKLFLTRLLLTILFNAFLQRYSAVYGRRPFILFALGNALIPQILVLLHLEADVPFYWFYLAKAWEMSLSLPVLCRSYFADLVSESSADMVFAVCLVCTSLSSAVGALLVAVSAVVDPLDAVIIALSLTGGALALALLFLPESISLSVRLNSFLSRSQAHADVSRATYTHWIHPFQKMYSSLSVLQGNDQLRSVFWVYAVFQLINQRDSELEMQYLQEVAGFDTAEQATYLLIYFLFAASVYGLVFPLWGIVFRRTYKDAFGLAFFLAAVKLFGMIFVKSRLLAYFLQLCGGLDVLVPLMIYQVMEHHQGDAERDVVATAASGVQSLSQGLSPVFHACVFALFRHAGVYFPGAPFVSLFCLAIIGLLLVLHVRVEKYGFPTPASTFLQILTLTFHSDDEDLESCMNIPVSGRGYFSEEDTNNSSTSTSDEEVFQPKPQFD